MRSTVDSFYRKTGRGFFESKGDLFSSVGRVYAMGERDYLNSFDNLDMPCLGRVFTYFGVTSKGIVGCGSCIGIAYYLGVVTSDDSPRFTFKTLILSTDFLFLRQGGFFLAMQA